MCKASEVSRQASGKAQSRLQRISAHLLSAVSASGIAHVGFDDSNFLPLLPLSSDKNGGAGRKAWSDMKTPIVEHQVGRRTAETGSSSLWRIHGKMYDLEKFMDMHPGGRVWLALTRGTDATQAVEAYHLDGARVEAVLSHYYVRDVKSDEFEHGDRFTFEENGFFRTLRRRVLERLRTKAGSVATTREATAATTSMKTASAVAIAQFCALHAFTRSSGSLLASAFTGISLAGCWGVGHNFMHQAEDKAGMWPYAMDLSGNGNAVDWRISHALSHHLDTNLDTDWEDANLVGKRYGDKDNNQPPSLLYLAPFGGLHFLVESIRYVARTLKEVITGENKSVGKHVGHIIPGLFPLMQLLSYVRGQRSFKKGVLLYLVQAAAFLLWFVPLALGVHHAAPPPDSEESKGLMKGPNSRNTYAWSEGQSGAQTDWGAHQVEATTDHSVYPKRMPAFLRDWLSLTLFGYLNNHTLHHLFPGIDQCHLHDLHDLLEETAKEFGIESSSVKAYPWQSLYSGFFRFNRRHVSSRL